MEPVIRQRRGGGGANDCHVWFRQGPVPHHADAPWLPFKRPHLSSLVLAMPTPAAWKTHFHLKLTPRGVAHPFCFLLKRFHLVL